MENFHINHWAVLVCAVANLALGAIWYSPLLFHNAWKKEANLTDEQLKGIVPAKVYGLTVVLALITSYNLAFYLGDDKTDMAWGAMAGFLTGFGFCTLIFTIICLFEQRSLKYILINGGFMTVYYTLIGFILGAWR